MSRRRGRPRGGKGGAEPRARIRVRELQVVEQSLEGRTQHEIAAALGISQPAVSKILQRVERRVHDEIATKIEHQRARHTMRLEYVYAEAIRAWRASKDEGLLRKRQRKSDGASGAGATVAEIVSETRHGDPRYLDEARKALADLRALWGVDAPERLAVEATVPFATLSEEALLAEITRQAQLLQRLSVPSNVSSLPSSTEDADDRP